MSSSVRSRFPFTATQWQELEHQALVFKYIVSGIPIPSDLLFTIRTSLDSTLSSKFLIHPPQHMGWNSFQMGFGRKIDPEPGRCRRTDGKKWRCSKEAYPDSKYCERHMHRGRNRSRKPVEILSPSSSNAPTPTPTPTPTPPPNSIHTPPVSLSESHFLYPHFPLSSQETPNFFLQPKDCSSSSYGHGVKGDHHHQQHQRDDHSSLTLMAPSHSQIKHHPYSSDHDYRHHHHHHNKHDDHGYYYDHDEREEQPKKVMHHFLDEWAPKNKDSWTTSEDKMPTHRTQLSISIPNYLHDFFVTQKW